LDPAKETWEIIRVNFYRLGLPDALHFQITEGKITWQFGVDGVT